MSVPNVKVDLQVDSRDSLDSALEQIKSELKRREAGLEPGLTAHHLKHIEAELATQKDRPFSLEHLELLQSYLLRFPNPPADLAKLHASSLARIQTLLREHPLASQPRSGDRVGVATGSGYFKVPLGRRRQMLVILYTNLLTGPTMIVIPLLVFWWYVPYVTYIFALYFAWVVYDNKTRPMPCPARISQAWRHSRFYRLHRDYFPIRLVRTQPLSPKNNYLFCYHPHGVLSAGAFSFGSAASGVDDLFPGISVSVQTLGINFSLPVTRENLINLGFGDASKGALMRALDKTTPGASALLVTGGALESMFAHPYESKVVLKERKGFVRIALATGADLVPVWSFGENNLFENLAVGSPRLLRWQRRIQRVISFAPLLVAGRGVFSYSGGLIPHRRPITVVVGQPISVGKPQGEVSEERVDEVHLQYKAAVKDLFESYKDLYDPKAKPIEFV